MLYEHASGYSLFRVQEYEEISVLDAEVQKSATDLSRFNSVVKLVDLVFEPGRALASMHTCNDRVDPSTRGGS